MRLLLSGKDRKRGRVANTLHAISMVLALLELAKAGVDLLQRLQQGQL